MKTESVKIKDLLNDPSNVRKHDERNIDAIKASLKRFGQQKPIVVDGKGIVVAGNGTLDAAKSLGWKEVQIVRTKLEGAEAIAYAVADNRTAELAIWDEDALAQTLEALHTDDSIDALVTGFTEQEIDDLIGKTADDIEEDEVPELPEEAITQVGDLWMLGEHRLLCGDSTSEADVARLMDGDKADMLLTDPPYNVALGMNETPEQAKARNRRADGKVVQNDHKEDKEFRMFLNSVFEKSFINMESGSAFYVWHSDSEGYNFRGSIRDCGQEVKQCLIWKKSSLVMGRQDYHWIHEPCLYGWKSGASHNWYSDRKQTTVLEFDKPHNSKEHPTMKPVELFGYQIKNSTTLHGLVLDPFMGSGTTLIACEQLNRKCYGMEIDPLYCDVIVKRWENLTGETAHLESVAPIK